ncbi:CPBP family intramembrane glutamic endopeptidase [Peptoniphilus vaginalis]|uniref:CPBP family intramembrane glutamic endopeptidase n=1 Tax=Peptoniphilus vaginalis TaxID=1756987 RepID=UPI0023F7BEBC|nr:type II CAAX endopeptidase family protein [Peptoniphilus vaginalis]
MKNIIKNIIFCSIYCLANWLVFNIIFSVLFLIYRNLDNNAHIDLFVSISFIVVTYLISKTYIESKNIYHKNLKIKTIDICVFVLVGILLATILFLLIYNIENKLNFIYYQRYLKNFNEKLQINDINIIALLEIIFTSIILVPIGEELYFRKIGITFLKSKGLGNKYAVLVSAFSFGLFHFRIISTFIYSFFIGLITGLLYVATDKTRYSIFTHGVNNLLAMSSALYYNFIFEDTPDIDFIMKYNDNITGITNIFVILLLLFFIKIFYKRDISYYKEKIIEIYKMIL